MKGNCIVTADASGAVEGARLGYVVVIIDVIDMSTSLEAALDAGALAVYGASFDNAKAPVNLNPYNIGLVAGKHTKSLKTELVVVTEPRVGTVEDHWANSKGFLAGVQESGASVGTVLPNIGAEVVKLADLKGKVIVAITGSGGAAFDAAFNAGAPSVLTATVARTLAKKGPVPALEGAGRAVDMAQKMQTGICLVAASSKSVEDVLAAGYIHERIISLREA